MSCQNSGSRVRANARFAAGRCIPTGASSSISRVHVPDRLPVDRRGGLALAAEQVPAAGATNLLRNPAAAGERRFQALQHDHSRSPDALVLANDDLLLQVAELLAQGFEELHGVVLGLDHRPDRRDGVEDALHADGIQRDDHRLAGRLAERLADLAAADAGASARIADDHEVRLRRRQRLDVQLARPDLVVREVMDGRSPVAGAVAAAVTTATPSISGG